MVCRWRAIWQPTQKNVLPFVVRTRATQQEHARSQFRSRRKMPKLRRGRVSRSKSSKLLRVTPHTSHNTWVINNPRLLLLRQAIPELLGLSCHHHHHWSTINSQKGAVILSSSATFGRNLKHAQSTALCLSRIIFTEKATLEAHDDLMYLNIFCLLHFLERKTIQEGWIFSLI
jgi:hypothetical protein